MATSFKREPKMMTTEPSVDEAKMMHGGRMAMKKGGMPMKMKDGKKVPIFMNKGGMHMMSDGKMMKDSAMKKGGKADMAQDKAMIKKAMSQHDAQEHKGDKGTNLKLRKGGMSSRMSNMAPKAGPNVMGGLAGGLEATRPSMKKMTSGVRMPGYKMGGSIAAKGGTKGIKQGPAGYKDGGHAAMSCMNAGGFATNKKMQKC